MISMCWFLRLRRGPESGREPWRVMPSTTNLNAWPMLTLSSGSSLLSSGWVVVNRGVIIASRGPALVLWLGTQLARRDDLVSARCHRRWSLASSPAGMRDPRMKWLSWPRSGALRFILALGLLAAIAFSVSPAVAHTGSTSGDLVGGLAHPLFGPDHLVAMVAVGLWGAFLGSLL